MPLLNILKALYLIRSPKNNLGSLILSLVSLKVVNTILILRLLALKLKLKVSRSTKFSEDIFSDSPISNISRLVTGTTYLALFTYSTILN
jgi:hypothetical protein